MSWLRPASRRIEAVVVLGLACALAGQAYGASVYFRKATVPRYAVSSDHTTAPVFATANAAPGDSGKGTLVVANVGALPARMAMTYQAVTRSRIDSALQLTIFDTTTQQCLWPTPGKPRKVKLRGKKVFVYPKVNPCATWGSWNANLHGLTVFPRGYSPVTKAGTLTPPGKLPWKRKERHVLLVSWRLPASLDGSMQRQSSAFRLDFRATKK